MNNTVWAILVFIKSSKKANDLGTIANIIDIVDHQDWRTKITRLFSMHNDRNSVLNDQLCEELKNTSVESAKIDAFLKTGSFCFLSQYWSHSLGAMPFYNSEILPRFFEPVWKCSDEVVKLLVTTFRDVIDLPDRNFQTALGKAIEYEKLDLLKYFGKPHELRGTVFQWVSSHGLNNMWNLVDKLKMLLRLFQAPKNVRNEKKSLNYNIFMSL